ncbi:MAG: hypothetical protein RIC38_05310, partial [Chromatocurvus sp.]
MMALQTPGRILPAAAGLALLVQAVPVVAGIPIWGGALLAAGLVYLLLLWRFPWLWLWVLPLVTVVLDLTPWTGWFLFNELDWFFLLTICGSAVLGRYAGAPEGGWPDGPARWLLLAYLLLLLLSAPGPSALWRASLLP